MLNYSGILHPLYSEYRETNKYTQIINRVKEYRMNMGMSREVKGYIKAGSILIILIILGGILGNEVRDVPVKERRSYGMWVGREFDNGYIK